MCYFIYTLSSKLQRPLHLRTLKRVVKEKRCVRACVCVCVCVYMCDRERELLKSIVSKLFLS